MNDPEIFLNPCALCKRRKGERLCDYIVDYTSVIFYRSSNDFLGQERHTTCDLPMCTDCATKYNGHDFCPHHKKIHEQVRKQPTEQLERARQQEQIRQLNEYKKSEQNK